MNAKVALCAIALALSMMACSKQEETAAPAAAPAAAAPAPAPAAEAPAPAPAAEAPAPAPAPEEKK
jgi:hypothetical protein